MLWVWNLSALCRHGLRNSRQRDADLCWRGGWHVTYLYLAQWVFEVVWQETSRGHRSGLYFILVILEWIRWQTRMNQCCLPYKCILKKWLFFFFPTYHIFGHLVSREILHILVFLVDYFWELSSIDDLFKYPHLDSRIKSVGLLDIFANNSCYGWSPFKKNKLPIGNTNCFQHSIS